jgi:hypothetical protein
MKHKLITTLFTAALHLLATPAHADLVLTQHMFVGAAQTPGKIIMSIKGTKMRTDNDTTSSVIIDAATGDMTTLMHEQKMVMTMNTKALAALMPKDAAPLPEGAATKVTATGKHETIDGHDCEIYTSENMGMVVTMWMAKDFPGHDKLKEALKPMVALGAPGAPKAPEIPGMMIKSEYSQQGLKFVTKHVSLEEKELSEDLFVAPNDYKPAGQ